MIGHVRTVYSLRCRYHPLEGLWRTHTVWLAAPLQHRSTQQILAVRYSMWKEGREAVLLPLGLIPIGRGTPLLVIG